MTATPVGIDFVGVVVPAHNEEAVVGRCLDSVAVASRHPALAGVEVRIVLILDRCDDTTGDRAEGRHLANLEIGEARFGNVGRARAEAMSRLLDGASGLAASRVWLATTDADSVVPADWLVRQLRWAGRGADAVAGTVRVTDWSEQSPASRRRFEHNQRSRGVGLGHGHVHGANLGLSAAAYLNSAGMPPLALAEDHGLWADLEARGHRLVAAPDTTVITSGRREGRAAGGFSDALRRGWFGVTEPPDGEPARRRPPL